MPLEQFAGAASNRYQVDLTEVTGYELETAGILKGGRKFWALVRTEQTTALKGNEQVNGYLLLATAHNHGAKALNYISC